MSIINEFRSFFNNGAGWVDREVISCDGWYISKVENFGSLNESNYKEFNDLVLESQTCSTATRNSICGTYVKYFNYERLIRKNNFKLECHSYVFETIKGQLFSHKINTRTGIMLQTLFYDLLKFEEDSEELNEFVRKFKQKRYRDSTYNYLFRIKNYCEDSVVSSNNFYRELSIEEGLRKSLIIQTNESFRFLSQRSRNILIDNIFSDCLNRLKVDIHNGGENTRYTNTNKFVQTILDNYWNDIKDTVNNFTDID